jgi:hypothetical protein
MLPGMDPALRSPVSPHRVSVRVAAKELKDELDVYWIDYSGGCSPGKHQCIVRLHGECLVCGPGESLILARGTGDPHLWTSLASKQEAGCQALDGESGFGL